MISAIYVMLYALLFARLYYTVIRLRKQYGVMIGNGGFSELNDAIYAYRTAIEQLPIAALLLITMEMNGAILWIVHLCGLLTFIAKIISSISIYRHDTTAYKISLIMTYIAFIISIITNLFYFPWLDLISSSDLF